MFLVIGGVYSDFTFSSLDPHTDLETYGMFETYESALSSWKANAWLNVDNALHRLIISKTEIPPEPELDD